ncbi:MAG: cyclodeaminase/cyclohydrolase family protein [Candidatus Omnitrophica bacterium]|nr:cyclodeaminase/cyclohydrolase family protein [Candidatus Omnitrophota bacterium]
MYIDEPISKYLNDLAARQPTPGGGSVAGLTGALGIALLEMVCNFTIGNKKYKGIEVMAMAHLAALKKIREEFMSLVDEDVKTYETILSAFRAKDEKDIDKALKGGYYISLKMCRLSKSGIDIALDLAAGSNVNLITDVGCGAELLKASFNSGVFNSEINLKGIKDEPFVEKEKKVLMVIEKEITDSYNKAISRTKERMV